jgi:hypothetical protein
MTPQDIIDRVSSRYDVLYYSDQAKLQALMLDTLGKFEDRAGAVRSFQILSPDTLGPIPADFLAVATVYDAAGRFVDFDVSGDTVSILGTYSYPVTVQYLVNFRAIGMDENLPASSIGLITSHFDAALAIHNARRERNVVMAAGLQREITSDDILQARLDAVELAMEENAEIIPMATI